MSRLILSQKFSELKNKKNVVSASALTAMLVLASCPMAPVNALEIDPIEIDEAIVEEAVVENNSNSGILPQNSLFMPTSTLLVDFLPTNSIINKYDANDHRFVPVSTENSSEHWENADYRTKITTINNTNQTLPIKITDKDGNTFDAVIYRLGNGQEYSYEIRIGSEVIVSIDYIGNDGDSITVNILKDVEFALRWQTNEAEYQYYEFNGGIGTYVLPKQKVSTTDKTVSVVDMWVGFSAPQPPVYDYVCKVDAFDVTVNGKTVTVTMDGEWNLVSGTAGSASPAITGYEIDFGDGMGYHSFDKSDVISYTYASAGEYDITAHVWFTNEKGERVSTKDKSDTNCAETVIIEDEPELCDILGFEHLGLLKNDPLCAPGKGKIDPPAAGIFATLAEKGVNTIAWFNIALGLVMTGAALTGFAIVRLLSKEDLTQ